MQIMFLFRYIILLSQENDHAGVHPFSIASILNHTKNNQPHNQPTLKDPSNTKIQQQHVYNKSNRKSTSKILCQVF